MSNFYKLKLLVALLGGLALVQAFTAEAQNDTPPPAASTVPEPTFTLGANEQDILKIIQTVAQVTGKTIIVEPSVKGKVKIMANENVRLTREEFYETFLAVLQLNNFTVVEVGNVLQVLPIKDARTSPIADAEPSSNANEIVTDVIPVENISASKLLQVLRPMVGSNGSIAPHDASNSIIITDSKANIDRVRRVIKKIDLAAISTTEVVQLKYATAEDLVNTLNKLEASEKKSDASFKLQIIADKRNNAILLVGEDLQRQRIKLLIDRLDRPQTLNSNVRVVYLDYADAVKVAETLTKVVQNLSKVAPGGGDAKNASAAGATVEADEDTNSLLITAEGDTLSSLLGVVEKLDIRRAQVLVEAIIVEINTTDGEELGVEWLFSNEDEGVFGSSSRGSSTSLGVAQGLLGPNAGVGTLAGSLAGIPGQTLGLAGINGAENFLALLHALNNSTKANVLSTPHLTTLDNKEATISVGQQVPFRTGSYSSPNNNGGNIGSPFTTIQREDIGISLKVKPQINKGNKVLLEIEQEVSSIGASVEGSADLITNESKIVTSILANDGEIVVLGGLKKENVTDGVQKVPVLGSIPILGNLFKYQKSDVIKANLMVFLRAQIVRTDDILNAATAEKYESIRAVQLEQRERGLSLMPDERIPVLPAMTLDDLNLSEEQKEAIRKELKSD